MMNLDRDNWPRRWITADWHLGDTRMDLLMRPFGSALEQTSYLLQKHNAMVSPDDLVIVVGDVACDPDELRNVSRFHGTKVLIRGNKDRDYSDEVLGEYFQQITAEGDGLELTVKVGNSDLPCWATHYPTCGRSESLNLVGHIHALWKVQRNALNVGVDCNHFAPHDLDQSVRFIFNAISNHYDDDVWSSNHVSNAIYNGFRGKAGSYRTSRP